jgi:HD-GYP domain-containing protein (c-di-GMP phosphodiesterase class II)
VVKFANLQKKEAKKEAEPDSSVIDELAQDEAIPQDATLDADDWYRRACQFLEFAFRRAKEEENFDVSDAEGLIEEIVQAHLEDNLPKELLIQALHKDESHSFLITNAVNVTIYAILVGGTLGLSKERLLHLGLAGLLHDIGKIRVPDEILYKDSNLTEAELATLRRYPYESFKILRGLGEEYDHLAECVLQVNEKLDGSGYPQGLQGDEINPYAQIIGLVDIYEAISHHRPQRQRFSHFQAVKRIIKTQKHAFYHALLKALLRTFSIFPLHSYVKLNSGAIGRVIQTFEEQPLRPEIEVVLDAQKRRVLVPRTLDLREQPILYVEDAVTEESLPA